MRSIDVLTIHYNTPELTSACIRSLWKHTPQARVTVFDNSDSRPFPADDFDGITYIDNTRGQIVDWDEWLMHFPDKMPCPENDYGSAKHCYSVELCYKFFQHGFVLMDSDVLFRRDIAPLCDPDKAFVGMLQCNTLRMGVRINRLCPWLCWINTAMLAPYDVHYFNPHKMWKLHNRDFYDTGAWFLEEALRTGLPFVNKEIYSYIAHFRAASWNKLTGHRKWLEENKDLWQ